MGLDTTQRGFLTSGKTTPANMRQRVQFEMELTADLAKFRFPKALQKRLHALLDKQDQGKTLTAFERREAQGLADLVDFLSLRRLRARRVGRRAA